MIELAEKFSGAASSFNPPNLALVAGDRRAFKLLTREIGRKETFRLAGLYGSGESALTCLPALKPEMVLLAANLPDMDEIECLRRLKPLLPHAQFVVLAASAAPEKIFNALAAGAHGYLLKATPGAELLAALHGIRQRGATLNSEIARNVLRSFQRPDFSPAISKKLSTRQLEVLELLAQGQKYDQIARQIQVGLETVKTHVSRLFRKLEVRSRSQAVALYTQSRRPHRLEES